LRLSLGRSKQTRLPHNRKHVPEAPLLANLPCLEPEKGHAINFDLLARCRNTHSCLGVRTGRSPIHRHQMLFREDIVDWSCLARHCVRLWRWPCPPPGHTRGSRRAPRSPWRMTPHTYLGALGRAPLRKASGNFPVSFLNSGLLPLLRARRSQVTTTQINTCAYGSTRLAKLSCLTDTNRQTGEFHSAPASLFCPK